MKTLLMVAVATSSLMVASGTSMATSAFQERKEASIRICTSAVAKRTGSSDISVYRTLSKDNYRTVWMNVGGSNSQFKCLIEKNGPDSYFIQSVRRL